MRFRFTLNSEAQGSLTLQRDPKGWKDIEVMLKRSLEYHGIFYEAMAQLEFTCRSGKEFIDKEIEERGIDAVVNILIQVSCQTGSGSVEALDYSIDYSDDYGSLVQGSGAPIFETLFEGVLNLSNYSQTSETTTVDLIQSDFVQKVINRFDTKINIDSNVDLDYNPLIPLSGVPYSLTLPSKAIRYASKLELDEELQADPFDFPDISDTYQFFYSYHPYVNVYDDLNFTTIFPIVENNDSLTYQPQPAMVAGFTGLYNISYNFAGNIYISTTDSNTVTVVYKLKYGINQTRQAATQIGSNFGGVLNGPGNRTDPFSFAGTLSVFLNQGDKFQIYIAANGAGAENNGIGLFQASIKLNYTVADLLIYTDTFYPESTTEAYPIHEAGAMIAQRITGFNDCFRSTLLGRVNSLPNQYLNNGCLSFCSISNGKKIRGYPDAENNLFVSMADFFKSVNSIGNIGLSFEKESDNYVLRLEEKGYYYSTDVVIQFPNARNIKISTAKEYYMSDIFIGYDKWENEEVNGIDEFNSKRQYNTGIKAISAQVDLTSPFIASSYATEFARRKPYLNFPSLDYKYDNDNFIFCLNRSVNGDGVPTMLGTVEKDENYDIINNVFSPESNYNYRISPARNLLRHLSVIAGSITKYADRVVKFVYGEGNYLAETKFTNDSCPGNFNSELLKESQDIPWLGSGADPLWIPEYIEFDYPLSFSDYLLIKSDPRKCIEVSEKNSNFIKGYIIEMRYKPVGGIATFKLLRVWESE